MTSSATEQPPGGLLDSPLEELIRLVLAIARPQGEQGLRRPCLLLKEAELAIQFRI